MGDKKRPVEMFAEGYKKLSGNYKDDITHNDEATKAEDKARKERITNNEASPMELLEAGFKQVDAERQTEEDANTQSGYNLNVDKNDKDNRDGK